MNGEEVIRLFSHGECRGKLVLIGKFTEKIKNKAGKKATKNTKSLRKKVLREERRILEVCKTFTQCKDFYI